MRRPWVPLATLIIVLVGVWGCDTGPVEPEGVEALPALIEELPRELSLGEERAIRASNTFGIDLLRELAEGQPEADHFISPLSASMVLGMVLNAAGPVVFESIRETLRFGEAPLEEINASYRGVLDLLLELDPRVSTQVANLVLHGDPRSPPSAEYLTRVRSFFDAEVRGGDFGDRRFAEGVNQWVRERTKGKIDSVVPVPIHPGGRLAPSHVFVNAIHFEGDWRRRFDEGRTYWGEFRLDDGRKENARFMVGGAGNRTWNEGLPDGRGMRVVELPYGGDAFVMTIILPPEGEEMGTFLRELDAARWAEIEAGLRWGTGTVTEVHLPRWRMEWSQNLLPTLREAFGMQSVGAFPHLSATLSDGAAAITDVTQKTFLRVDERGTEASAVTTISIRAVSSGPSILRVDRPFVFAIRERLSGTILFLGVMRNAPSN